MKSLIFLLSVILTIGCSNPKKENIKYSINQPNPKANDTNFIHGALIEKMQINVKANGNVLMIKDSILYSKNFIKDLYQLNSEYKSLILIGDTLYYSNDGKNEYYECLPTELPLKKVASYLSEEGKNKYTLRLIRLSLTNIYYELLINDSLRKKGTGLLHGSFFFAAEIEDDINEQNSILCRQYNDSINPFIAIKVEMGTGNRVVLYMYNDIYRVEGMVFKKN